jgi:glutathione peroxidase-family protein
MISRVAKRAMSTVAPRSLHEFTLNTLSGEAVKMEVYAGRVVLLENVATL